MVAAIGGEMERNGVVPARAGAFRRAHPRMLPALVFHVPKSNDPPAIDAVEGAEPRMIVEIRWICIEIRAVGDLTIVLDAFERGADRGARHIMRRKQMNHSLIVAK